MCVLTVDVAISHVTETIDRVQDLTCSEMTIGNTTIHYWIYYYANWYPNGKAFRQFFKTRHQTLKCDL